MASENKLQEVVQSTLAQIRNMIDANTVIGTPVETSSGTTIIPISKVAMGFATGGVDFNDKTGGEKDKPQNFGAGGGTGLTMQPIGFLVIDADGKVEMLNVGLKNPSDPIEQIADLIERSPEIISRVKALLGKDKPVEE